MKKLHMPSFFNTRLGLFSFVAILIWLKNIFAYSVDFHLRLENMNEYFILLINPIATTIFLLAIALYIRRTKASYITMIIIYFLMSLLLFSNAIYYREFTDFITVNTMLGAGKVSSGLGESAIRLFRPYDIIYLIDPIIITGLLLTKKIKMDVRPVKIRMAVSISLLSIVFFLFNLFMAETARPQLLGRQFSRDYIVKFLGINAFTIYDGVTTYQTNQIRAEASPNDIKKVKSYIDQQYAAPDNNMFGIAKGKNVIYIHLESFQQFLIDYKLKDKNGVEHEVTPFLNSLFHDKSTFGFDNFFHQVGQGKTSDAENMFENSIFGLDQGSLFTQVGGKNTFEAAPAILNQKANYTTAVFHGNAGNFWNRNETYKRLGFNYFFDANYFDVNDNNSFQYGLHDKPFFKQSVKYLEHLQQPFYTKFISVSNHYPYSQFTGDEAGFPIADTPDETINGYFSTANYLDKAVEEFFNYLKASKVYENSVIVLYGDHFGISNSRNKDLAELLGKSKSDWNDYDNSALQRVPYMIHIPGQTKGGINHTYGGEIDALPTLLHLLGIDTKNYIQLGQDLFSQQHKQVVTFRNGNIVSKKYTILGSNIYDTATGTPIDNQNQTEITKNEISTLKKEAHKQLEISDQIVNGDLLRYYGTSGLKAVDPTDYNYKKQLPRIEKIEKDKGNKSTSIYSKHNNKSTTDLYHTNSYQGYLKATENK
ncbi:LTA synthase family protein [Melissococcus plutonius]|uniref:Lipoteichoic acid synthase n=1 Tax=Melissococcus plutonius TaxID=33970 RepID=A0A2Z5Y2D4_9ENTE|nr:LTA synthase family protein [Melissococcus plutonius]BAL62026.1 lipoteichoic acid synthase LtaS type IIc [Melissococcus plutonius DAT561]MCV2499149.1 LTA synthase family protein [Melissococcus plutonius]MCV2500335.1 LTA synthase family protein [Melissococcus plutonius]MCV2505128.1 LTA synthase family protein [Melissococcus plutonius]MCV2507654.1 LTA synthase family protein [Melissococcus plutonius]